jgi:hypothetical protein
MRIEANQMLSGDNVRQLISYGSDKDPNISKLKSIASMKSKEKNKLPLGSTMILGNRANSGCLKNCSEFQPQTKNWPIKQKQSHQENRSALNLMINTDSSATLPVTSTRASGTFIAT